MKDDKIIQIETSPPLQQHSTSPFLFGLGDSGRVYYWDWHEEEWKPLEEMV